MKEAQRQRIEQRLQEIAAWRASGLPLKTYVQQRGENHTLWRARLTWERRWQQMLEGTYKKPTPCPSRRAFVQALAHPGTVPAPTRHRQSTDPTHAQDQTNVCIAIAACAHSGLQARVHWPIDHIAHSSAWLREVLA